MVLVRKRNRRPDPVLWREGNLLSLDGLPAILGRLRRVHPPRRQLLHGLPAQILRHTGRAHCSGRYLLIGLPDWLRLYHPLQLQLAHGVANPLTLLLSHQVCLRSHQQERKEKEELEERRR